MEPTFQSGDYILTSRVTYKMRAPERGDVVVFKSPKNPDIEYIKRIIGLPGDKLLFENGNILINGKLLQENYIAAQTNLWEGGYVKEGAELTIPDGDIFVMGDNRPRSSDSREFGPVAEETIIGQVFFRYFPSDKVGSIANPLKKQF